MSEIRLKLIGEPSLYCDGVEVVVSPRSVFELLAVILCAGDSGVPRKELAARLWGHLGPSNSRTQVRIAAHRLRQELSRFPSSRFLDLDGQILRCVAPVMIDLSEVQKRPPKTLAEISPLLKPIAEGWNPEHWVRETDHLGELVYAAMKTSGLTSLMSAEQLQLLTRAASVFPTTVGIHALLVKALRSQQKEAELNEAIIRFEDHWVGRFGNGDVPKIADIAENDNFKPHLPERTNRGNRWPWILGSAGALLAIAFVAANPRKRRSDDESR